MDADGGVVGSRLFFLGVRRQRSGAFGAAGPWKVLVGGGRRRGIKGRVHDKRPRVAVLLVFREKPRFERIFAAKMTGLPHALRFGSNAGKPNDCAMTAG
jgi:hypothetical protein